MTFDYPGIRSILAGSNPEGVLHRASSLEGDSQWTDLDTNRVYIFKKKEFDMKRLSCLVIVAASMMVLGSSSYAEEVAGEPQMDPVMMEKMKALMSPSAAHQVLEPLAGRWSYTGYFWMSPDAPAEEMMGAAQNTLVYGGRFLKQEIEGPWMGETFHGLGFVGYDNIKEEYVSTWLDSMSTGIMTVTGQYDQATKTLKQSGSNSCPLTGEKARYGRSEWTVTDGDHNTYTSYMAGPDGNEFKTMEIKYTRAQ